MKTMRTDQQGVPQGQPGTAGPAVRAGMHAQAPAAAQPMLDGHFAHLHETFLAGRPYEPGSENR